MILFVLPKNQSEELLSLKYSKSGVILDSDLNFESHVSNIRRATLYHFKNIIRV